MSGLHVVKVAVDLRLEVPAAMLEARSAGSADLVGGQLARHYSPCTVKLGLILSSLNRDPSPRGMDQFARRMIWRWLRDRFEHMDVTSAQVV